MLATIAQIKNSNNAPLSPKEKKAFEDFANSFTGSTAFINEMGQEAKRIADEMKKTGDFDGAAFKNLAESLEFIRRYANQFEINRARNADTRRTERTNAKEQAIELAKKHGVFCGISAGANVCAAKVLAEKYPERLVVAIIPDSGERYLSVW